MHKGFVFYIVGSSGVGKDTIINKLKSTIALNDKFIFTKRFITRPNVDGNEKHIQLSKEDFQNRVKHNLFSLYWEAHNNLYGVGIELEYWTFNGYNVFVNGSREYKEIAKLKYPNLKSILIDAEKSVIYERLIGRKRESVQLIEKRMMRNEEFSSMDFDLIVRNESTIENAVDSILYYINNLTSLE